MKDEKLDPIITGCLNKERKCQEILYRQYYGYGMSICLRYSSSREEAVEVLNESFLKVFTHLHLYNRGMPFKAWLRKILINTSINHYKKYSHAHPMVALEGLPALIERGSNGLDQLTFQEMISLIQQLSPTYRTVFNLYVIEGYNHREIAHMLQITEGASKSNLSRARANLRNLFERNNEKGLEKLER